METIASDLQQMLGESAKSDSLLQLLGMDVDSSFKNPKSHTVFSDPIHISQGVFTPGQQIQVNLDSDGIHYLHQCMIGGQFVSDKVAYAQNIQHIFRVEQVRIGDVTYALNDAVYINEQQTCKTLKPMLSKHERGLLLKDPSIIEGTNYQAADVFDQPIIPQIANDGAVTFTTNTQNSYPHAFQTVLKSHFLKLSDRGDQWVVDFAIPLHLLCPTLQYLPDAGAVFVGKGQPLQMQISLVAASECLFAINGSSNVTTFTYSIQNLQFLDVYTSLDAPRMELIQRSQMRFPIQTFSRFKEPVVQSTINANFPLTKAQRAKKLLISFHWNGQASKTADSASVNANLCNETAAPFKSSVGYHPRLPISQVLINWGSRQYQVNVPTTVNLGLLDVSSLEDDHYYSDVLYRQNNKYVFALDMARFSVDDFGSSSDGNQIFVQLLLKTGVRTMNGQTEDWTDNLFKNFRAEFTIVCQEFIEMNAGRYRMG